MRSTGLLDRSAEFGEVARIVATARSGPARLLHVIGEAGIGKTALIGEIGGSCSKRSGSP